MSKPTAVVRYEDETAPIDCPYGTVTRVVTAGLGGVANVHVVRVSGGGLHHHLAYDEVYYLLAGRGTIWLDGEPHPLRPGAVVVIPRRVEHRLEAAAGESLEFIIFGTPALPISDPRARPTKRQ